MYSFLHVPILIDNTHLHVLRVLASVQAVGSDVNIAMGQEPSLTRGEKHQIRRLLKPIEGDDEVNERDGNELLNALQDHSNRKKARVAPPSVYRSVKHVFFYY